MAVLTALAILAGDTRVGAALSPAPVLDWLFDNEVAATARVGHTLFVGGGFTDVAPAANRVGTVVTLQPTTGTLVTAYPPYGDVTGTLNVTLDDAGGYYAVAQSDVGGTLVPDVVHVRPDGTRDPAFTFGASVANVNSGSFARTTLTSASLIAWGTLRVGGVDRAIAAFDRSTGALLPWTPAVPATAFVMSVLASPTRLFVLWNAGAQGTDLAAFDVVTGAELWHQTIATANLFEVGRLALAGDRLVVKRGGVRVVNAATGAITVGWSGAVDPQYFFDVVASGNAAYVSSTVAPYVHKFDLASGALLPWPVTLAGLPSLAPSPTGGVFVSGPVLVAGQPRQGPVEINANGVVTSWTPAITGAPAGTSPTGDLVVVREAVQGPVRRPGLVVLDLTTGGLASLNVGLGGPSPTVDDVRSDGQRVFIHGPFTTVNGQPRAGIAAIDGTTGALLDWPAAGAPPFSMVGVDGGYVYVSTSGGPRRIGAASGVLDSAWTPAVLGFLAFANGEILIARRFPESGFATATLVGTLDPVTGMFRELARLDNFVVGIAPVIDGDTIYIAGNVPGFGIPPIASALAAIDRKTGVRVDSPRIGGAFRTLTLAAGRLVAGGERMTVNGGYVYGAVELARPSARTSWDSGFRLHSGYVRGLLTNALGDVLVVAGTIGDLSAGGVLRTYNRVAAFATAPHAAPTNLRARPAGATTLFTWDAAVPAPSGGYVIEGGFTSGQTAGALAVGSATSIALPMPPGPAFIRVRPQGGGEVSNEVVAGCVAPPLPPTALTAAMTGTTVSFAWTGTPDAAGYVFSAGTARGQSDAATVALPPSPTQIGGTVPGGTYFVRVAASNACGTSAPSGEVFVTIGAPDPLPAAPTNLTSTVTGSTLTLAWTAPAGPVTGYVLEAGSAPGLANIGAATVGAATSFVIPGVPPGTYYVRVRAITSAGSGAASSDIAAAVP